MNTPHTQSVEKMSVSPRILLSVVVLAAGLLLFALAPARAVSYTTAAGTGADVYVFEGDPNSENTNYNGADSGYLAVVSWGSSWSRKTYLRFDTAGLTGTVQNASLQLDCVLTGSTTINVYGLIDSASGQNWGETAITWNNAPGNNTSSNTGVDANTTVYLGAIATTGDGYVNLSAASLATFLNTDTDHLVTFILAPTVVGVSMQAYSKDVVVATADMYPTLTVTATVPEPASALILLAGAGSLTLLRRRRTSR